MNRRDLLFNAIGSALGLGLSPIAPGSFGALLGVVYALLVFTLLPIALRPPAMFLGLAAVAAANHFLTPWATEYWKDEDPRHFVLDEIAGYLMVPLLLPQGTLWQIAFWGFLLFRIIDVIKIPPARQVDQTMTGSWGILLDDLISGAYAAGLIYAYRWLGPFA
ncbi:MAG: phosphatidylglycerophosphatase A family protein [Vicinamibacteria bacterium]